jgi:hypothetical protein
MREPRPRPASTTTSKPSPFSRFTVSGDAATRGSPRIDSLGNEDCLTHALILPGRAHAKRGSCEPSRRQSLRHEQPQLEAGRPAHRADQHEQDRRRRKPPPVKKPNAIAISSAAQTSVPYFASPMKTLIGLVVLGIVHLRRRVRRARWAHDQPWQNPFSKLVPRT